MTQDVARLDLRRIVDISLKVADAEGLDRLTMRRLSSELGVTPMAIYRYVKGKDELLDLVADESLRTLPDVDVDGLPVTELTAWAQRFHTLLVGHPALAQAMAMRRLQGPLASAAALRMLKLLARHGVRDEQADALLVWLFSATLGAALYRVSRTEAYARHGRRELPKSHASEQVRQRLSGVELTDEAFLAGVTAMVEGFLR